ncbi:lachesin [Culex quinquefasciatus]|uniref:Lachesin n=1 Tax=Culex quinquefasciatus TaxID=7176 RepID=B0XB05_CULQU|nr:lachesin [Culex quinquefasciatus]|eukprot:XP_001866827.1 lachesin [Culex quinquefasciatus]
MMISMGGALTTLALLVHVAKFGVFGQQFKSVPTTVKTYENETVLLPCYHNAPYRYVRWSRDDMLLVDTRNPELPVPPRVQLWKNGSLEVSTVQMEDTGDYTCEITTEGGRAIQQHAIEIPQRSPCTRFGRVEVKVGQIVEVVCDATGCTSTATNGVGDPAVETLDLVVDFAPEVTVPVSVVHTKVGQSATLECFVTSRPTATIHWFHKGLPLPSEKRLIKHDTVVSTSQYHSVRRHALFIRNIKDADLGRYECKAENRIGLKGAHLELTGRPMPAAFKPSAGMSSSTTHHLIWQVESFSPIIEYKLRFRKIPSGDITPTRRYPDLAWSELIIPSDGSAGPLHSIGYTLHGLQAASVYEVVVLARNRYGTGDASNILRFATGGEVELPEITETTSQLGADGDYADEDGGQEDPNITDNVIPRDFYDYEQQFTSESRTDGARGGSGAGSPTGTVCMGVVSWVVVLICSRRVFRE